MGRNLTFNLVLSHVDEGRRRDGVRSEVVDHLDYRACKGPLFNNLEELLSVLEGVERLKIPGLE